MERGKGTRGEKVDAGKVGCVRELVVEIRRRTRRGRDHASGVSRWGSRDSDSNGRVDSLMFSSWAR